MKKRATITILLALILTTALGISLFYEVTSEKQPCQEARGSVCTTSECPEGYVATLQYACGSQAQNCCIPNR